MTETLRKRIHKANIAVHQTEAKYYELIHPEVYGKQEQKRINALLKKINKLIDENRKRALDFGAGTGNLSGKLLKMGYKVTAVDISPEMCRILREKYKYYLEAQKLIIINSPIEDLNFDSDEFDLITCYSVLHHLPDYTKTVHRLTGFLKKGGVMYIDHEISPFYWENESDSIANIVKYIYFHSNPLLNALYFKMLGIEIPSLDYKYSDYWHKKEHSLDHNKIEQVFRESQFNFFERRDYHLNGTWFANPIFYIYKYTCKPEMSSWVAKK